MARTYNFGRQQAEDLVDLLEANPDFQLHDQTAFEMAAELREIFGMCTHAEEIKHKSENLKNPPVMINIHLDVSFYEGNFSDAFSPLNQPRR